jgi:hypothetical protein
MDSQLRADFVNMKYKYTAKYTICKLRIANWVKVGSSQYNWEFDSQSSVY